MLAEEGEKVRSFCAMACTEGCAELNDCWSVEPEVRPNNEETWRLYQLFETRWVWGAGGYRLHYDSTELTAMAKVQGSTPGELRDIAERVKVIELAMLEIEEKRFKYDENRKNEAEAQEREAGKRRLASGVR